VQARVRNRKNERRRRTAQTKSAEKPREKVGGEEKRKEGRRGTE